MTDTDVRLMRPATISLRRKLGDNTENPAYIVTELRVGCRMPKRGCRGSPVAASVAHSASALIDQESAWLRQKRV